jgi:hypothetical protein
MACMHTHGFGAHKGERNMNEERAALVVSVYRGKETNIDFLSDLTKDDEAEAVLAAYTVLTL